ncbi:MAG: hypothetical protein KF782_06530 [Labilithrix sp.]|nr:hypothetical protein [Labilithrix sp.]
MGDLLARLRELGARALQALPQRAELGLVGAQPLRVDLLALADLRELRLARRRGLERLVVRLSERLGLGARPRELLGRALRVLDGAREIVALGADGLEIRQGRVAQAAQVRALVVRELQPLLELLDAHVRHVDALEGLAPLASLVLDRALDGGGLLVQLRQLAAERERRVRERVDRALAVVALDRDHVHALGDRLVVRIRPRIAARRDGRARGPPRRGLSHHGGLGPKVAARLAAARLVLCHSLAPTSRFGIR